MSATQRSFNGRSRAPRPLLACSISADTAEMIGAEFGIGAYILMAGALFSIDQLIAGVAILSVLGLTIGWLIGRAERYFLNWRT